MVILCKAFLYQDDVHQSEIAPDRVATGRHVVELRVRFITHGCTSLPPEATSGSDLLAIRRDWTERRGSGEEEVAQSSATLAKHFITSSHGNTMKSLPTSRMWNHSAVVLAANSKMLLSLEAAKEDLFFCFGEGGGGTNEWQSFKGLMSGVRLATLASNYKDQTPPTPGPLLILSFFKH